MSLDAWLPIGFVTPQNYQINIGLYEGDCWQIYKSICGGNILIVKEFLLQKWQDTGLVEKEFFGDFTFGGERFFSLTSTSGLILAPVGRNKSPDDKLQALSFAESLKISRQIDCSTSLHDGIFVERYSRVLPTYTSSKPISDDIVLGSWLTGGIPMSVNSGRRIKTCMNWLPNKSLEEIIQTAGLSSNSSLSTPDSLPSHEHNTQEFKLAGRPDLEKFFFEHVIDIIQNEERYKTLGILFPSAVVLHGPPGCGKTYAVEKMVEYLGWPIFEVNSMTVASPFIHETSKKVSEIFEKAIQNAPSVLVIDEMEAFLADRGMGASSGHHRVEEVAEFLRRIPEAINNKVLIIAMTNRIEMIDSAILRRGRFDHLVKVDMPSKAEVKALLEHLLHDLPSDDYIDLEALSNELKGRPLSDVSFTVREGARLSAKNGSKVINQENLLLALGSSPSRESELATNKKIGF